MKSGQQGIFYISADSVHAAESSPFVEKLQKRDLEVRALMLSLFVGGAPAKRPMCIAPSAAGGC